MTETESVERPEFERSAGGDPSGNRRQSFDVAVVGAGIVGAACAAALAGEGLSVVVVDERGPASGTTAAGMGHIVVMDDSDPQFALTEYSRRLWARIADRLPVECEFDRCGTIWVAADDDELHEAQRKADYYSALGVAAEILDERSLRAAEPNLREGLAGGLLIKGDSVVYQPQATSVFLKEACAAGAKLIFGQRVESVSGDGVTLRDGSRIAAKRSIVAAGVGACDLVPGIRIRRKKGHLLITERYPEFVRHQIIELGYLKSAHSGATDSVAFNVQPRRTEQILIGSSRQLGAEDDRIDYGMLDRMLRRAFDYMPGLRKVAAVRAWTGFRPATDDNLPAIGRHPRFENVFLAAGHEGLGITTSTGTAAILTDMIVGREPTIDATPYDPARLF